MTIYFKWPATIDEWRQEPGSWSFHPNHPQIRRYLDTYPNAGTSEWITANAAFAGGTSNKGQRHFRSNGGGNPGTNHNSGGTNILMSQKIPAEFYCRFYMRWSNGFRWDGDKPHYTKDNFWEVGEGVDRAFVFGHQGGNFGGYAGKATPNVNMPSTWSWKDANNGSVLGANVWHCYEYHIKIDKANDNNSVFQLWVGGKIRLDRTGPLGLQGDFTNMVLGSNQNKVLNASGEVSPPGDFKAWWTDYAELIVSDKYNGPIGSGGEIVIPNPPTKTGLPMKLTAVAQGLFHVSVDGVDVSEHVTEREAIERAVNEELENPGAVVEYRHDYSVRVEALAEPEPEPPPSTSIGVGSTVETLKNSTLRVSPSSDSASAGDQAAGSRGTAMESAVDSTGVIWWRVDFASGVDGWLRESKLRLAGV